MDGQDHKITATSLTQGHEGHGVHLCHRCGWPFPNPHPSAKHRRAHKRVCGTVEGYKILHSGDSDHHLAVSDDDNASDDDELHTPSPNIVKKNAGSSVRELEKSATLEDDVFSDAVTDFSDSGSSQRLEERFESARELGKSLEQKSVEGDLHGSESLEVKEASDTIEESNDTSEEICKHGPTVNGNSQADNAILITDTATKLASVELTDDLQPKNGVGGSEHGEMIPGHDADFQVQEHGLASVTSCPEKVKVSGPAIVEGESQDTLRGTLASAVAEHDPPPPSEPLQNLDASEVINTVVHSAEIVTSTETFEAAPIDNTGESIDASVGVKDVSHSSEKIGSTESIGGNISLEESPLSSSPVMSNESTDIACMISSTDKEEMPNASLDGGQTTGDFDASEEEKSEITGSKSLEPNDSRSVDSNSALNSTDNAFAFEDDNTKITEKDISHCGENINSKDLGTENDEGEGASVEADEYKLPSETLTEFSSSYAVDSDAKGIHELPENNSGSLEIKDDGLEKSIQSHGVDTVTEVLQSVGSAEAGFEVECTTSNNIHVSRDVSETPEESISKESASSLSNSLLLSRNSAEEENCIREDANTSESIATTEEKIDEIKEISESPTPCVQEASLDVKPTHSSDELSTSKSVDAPSEKQPVPTPSDVQEFLGTLDTADKTVVAVEDVTSIDVKSVLSEVDDKSTKQTDDASAIDVSESLSSRSDSLEANCGSIVSDTLETNTQKNRSLVEEVQLEKSDTFEPPSFMTLVQSGSEGDQATAATEIEAVQKNQQPKPDALQAGWFPSLTNVVNESEGRKKNEEMIAKVTNWSPVKQQHSPLKSLLSEVKSPNTNQVPAANQKVDAETKDDSVGATAVSSVKASETHTTKDQDTNKHVEEWNSPARYPIEVKKEKKGRPFWVPFVCCSSTHREL